MQQYWLLLLLMTVKDLEHEFSTAISPVYGTEEALQLFYLAAEHISGLSRMQLLIKKDMEISMKQYHDYEHILAELKQGRPIQHILSYAWFYGLKFRVNSAVLIPRPETEELVSWIISLVKELKTPVSDLIDIGTGSGCIAITLKKELAHLSVSALDISVQALAVARENAVSNQTEINFIHADILSWDTETKYDVIVSNPPYIKEDERAEMSTRVLDHEPHTALFVTDENPLIFYKSIADLAINHLRAEGQLFFEINEYLGNETVEMLFAKGFKNIALKKDMQGKNRMIRCNI